MMRQAQSAMRLLLRMQAARQKIEADSAAADRAAWTEHCAAGLMAQALPGARPAAMAEPPLRRSPFRSRWRPRSRRPTRSRRPRSMRCSIRSVPR